MINALQCVTVVLVCGVLSQFPLTPDLEYSANHKTYFERIHYPTGSGDDWIVYDISLQNADLDWGVSLAFTFGTGDAYVGEAYQFHSTSFKPTAVCKRTGTAASFFVAGWDETSGGVVLEEWTVVNVMLGELAHPTGGTGQSVLSTPEVRKVNKLLSPLGTGPLTSVAYNYLTNELLLLDVGIPRGLHVLDLSTGLITSSLDAATLPILTNRVHLVASVSSIGGFMVIARDHQPWVSESSPSSGGFVWVSNDADLDGVFDQSLSLSTVVFRQQYPSGTWNVKYSE